MPSGRLAGSSALCGQRRQVDARGRCRAPRSGRRRSRARPPTACNRWAASRARLGEHRVDRLHQRRAAHMHRARAAMAGAALHRRACRPARSGTPRSAGPAGRRRSARRRSRGPGRWTRVPTATVTVPSLSKRTSAPSLGAPREVSRKQPTPMPRSRPCAFAAARRAAKPAVSARASGGVEIGDEAARIDRHAHGGPVRERGDQVLPPQLGRIAAEPRAPRPRWRAR